MSSSTVIVAQGDGPDTLRPLPVYAGKQLRHGAAFTVTLTLPRWEPVAPLLDLAKAESFAEAIYAGTKARLKDVEGKGLWTVILHMEANAFSLASSVVATLGQLLGKLFKFIKGIIEAPFNLIESGMSTLRWVAFALIALAALMLILAVMNPAATRRVVETAVVATA